MSLERKILTDEEHLNYIHLCGMTGKEAEEFSDFCTDKCEKFEECLLSHGWKGVDEASYYDIKLLFMIRRLKKEK